MYDTKLTVHLPGIDVEVSRQPSPDGAADTITISLRAVSDPASAAARLMPGMTALLMGPYAAGNGGASTVFMPMDPWRFWLQATHAAWAPWMAMNPWLAAWIGELPQVDEAPQASPR